VKIEDGGWRTRGKGRRGRNEERGGRREEHAVHLRDRLRERKGKKSEE